MTREMTFMSSVQERIGHEKLAAPVDFEAELVYTYQGDHAMAKAILWEEKIETWRTLSCCKHEFLSAPFQQKFCLYVLFYPTLAHVERHPEVQLQHLRGADQRGPCSPQEMIAYKLGEACASLRVGDK